MRAKARSLLFLVLVVLLLMGLPAVTALADDGDGGGKIVFGDDFVLESGEELEGGVVAFGGDVTLRQGSLLAGDVLAMGGSVTVAGAVDGDIAAFGGDVRLDPTSEVDGDVVALGGNVTRLGGAVVRGSISEGFSFEFGPWLRLPETLRPATAWQSWWNQSHPAWTWFTRAVRSLVTAIVLAVLAVIVAALWPKPTERLANAIWSSPGATLGMGLLTLLVVPGLAVLLAILLVTACLVPLLAIAAAASFLFGWIGLGLLVGRRLLLAFKAGNVSALWQACLGVAAITVAASVPCLGLFVWLIGGAFGLGAVVLTRFGTQRFTADGKSSAEALASSQATEPKSPGVATPDESAEPEAEAQPTEVSEAEAQPSEVPDVALPEESPQQED